MGRQIVEEALKRGHKVTIMHRGERGAELFGDKVERIFGNRDGELSKLGDGPWDAVVDTCGYVPRVVGASAECLKDKVSRYLFVSTISVYGGSGLPAVTEETPVKDHLEDPASEEITGESYGPLKVLCEQAVQSVYGDRATIVRPGLVVGPNDPSDRFTYWPLRMRKGGQVVVPDRKDQPLQFIDVRDLAHLCLNLLENEAAGVFNGTGPSKPYCFGSVIETVHEVVNPEAELVWVDPERLEDLEVQPWTQLPFYLGRDEAEDGLMRADNRKALAQGLSIRPLAQTAKDTLEWALSRGDVPLKNGLPEEKEAEILSTLTGMVI